ncbi:MAG: ABC transporter ATP-binding protein [Bacillota bacterium]
MEAIQPMNPTGQVAGSTGPAVAGGNQPLVDVRGLSTVFKTDEGTVKAVDDVSFHIARGETLGMVGESGCGKSVTSLSILRLIPSPPGRIASGVITFDGRNLMELSEAEMRQVRGNRISMIFQEPMTSLNPVFTVGDQIAEAIVLHQKVKAKEAMVRTIEMLKLVGIPLPERRVKEYPHQLSGGMRQRVMIAMALSCNPQLLIADEPTTALDVTIQAQILDLMRRLRREFGMSILLITHDLGVIAEMAERVVVMYAGQIVEEAPVDDLFESPLHPYTLGLLKSIPRLDSGRERLHVIEGMVPSLVDLPAGCRFRPRCPEAIDRCAHETPVLLPDGPGRYVRCWKHGREEAKS